MQEAKKLLKEVELDIKISNSYENLKEAEVIIKEQFPKAGITQEKGNSVVCEIK